MFYQAELIKSDLDKAVQKGGGDVEPHREQFDIRYSVRPHEYSLNKDKITFMRTQTKIKNTGQSNKLAAAC